MSYKYNAFISYQHNEKDTKVVEHIVDGLERYHFPKSIRKMSGFNGSIKVFRDKYNLPVTDSLNDTIGNALKESEYLIVVCSDHTKKSMWVEKEIKLFLATHPRKNIFTVLVEGEPLDVIPDVLLYEEKEVLSEDQQTVIIRNELEPLSADYRSGITKSRKTELPRLVAGLIGCSYENLMQRQQQHKNRMLALTVSVIGVIIALAIAYVIQTSLKIQKNYEKALYNKSEYLSQESVISYDEENNMDLATQLAMAAVPQKDNDMPYNPLAQFALFNAVKAYDYPYKSLYTGLRSFEGDWGEDYVTMSCSNDGKYLAAYSYKRCLYIWDTESAELLKKEMLDFSVPDLEVKFSDSKLMVFSSSGLKAYRLDDLSKDYSLPADNVNYYIDDYASTNDRIYLLNKNLGTDNHTWNIEIYDEDTMDMVSKIPLNLETRYIYKFIVSSDNRYCCIVINDSIDIKEPDRLLLIDLESGEYSEEKLFEDKTKPHHITDICFIEDDIIFSTTVSYENKDSFVVDGVAAYKTGLIKCQVMCYDFQKNNYKWKISDFDSKQYSIIHLQNRLLKNVNSGQYQNVIVMVSDNMVMIVDPEKGNILQKDFLPFRNLSSLKLSTTETSEYVPLFSTKDQTLVSLYFDNSDTKLFYNQLYFEKSGINDLCESQTDGDNIFVCFKNGIIHYKKGQGDMEYTMLQDDAFYSVKDQISFNNYLAVLVMKNINDDMAVTMKLYDLRKKKLIYSKELDESFRFLGVADGKIILNDDSGSYNIYNLDDKSFKKIELDLKKDESDPDIVTSKICGSSIIALINGIDHQGNTVLYRGIYDLKSGKDDFVIDSDNKMIDESLIYHAALNNDGDRAFIDFYGSKQMIYSFDSGKSIAIDGIEENCTSIIWNDRYIGLYDGGILFVCTNNDAKEVMRMEIDNLLSFSFDDDYVYCLKENMEIIRYSLIDGKKKGTLLTKLGKFPSIDLKAVLSFDLNTADDWYFDNEIIRILYKTVMIEVDKDSLEMIGYCDKLCSYCKDMNMYCVNTYDNNSLKIDFDKTRLCLYKCYSLEDLIKKGKDLTNGKELNKQKKMRYGLE